MSSLIPVTRAKGNEDMLLRSMCNDQLPGGSDEEIRGTFRDAFGKELRTISEQVSHVHCSPWSLRRAVQAHLWSLSAIMHLG